MKLRKGNLWKSTLDTQREQCTTRTTSLLHVATKTLDLIECYCLPGKCMSPTIMGIKITCRDPEKANHT